MKAMVLAAGVGSRLAELTHERPKCLMDIGATTILGHVLGQLRAAGVTDVAINLHHHAAQVRDYLDNDIWSGLNFEFSYEEQLLGTGGGVQKMKHFFCDEEFFLVHNADIYTEFDLSVLLKEQARSRALGTLAVMLREDSSYLLFDENDRLAGWQRGETREVSSHITDASLNSFGFCGIQVLSAAVFEIMSDQKPPFSLIETYMRAVSQGRSLKAFRIDNHYWVDIGTPAQLNNLRARRGAN